MNQRFEYIRSPESISEESFRIIEAEVDFSAHPGVMGNVARRIVHAQARSDLPGLLRYSPGAAEAGMAALAGGAKILVDAQMVARGITGRFLPKNNEIICRLDDDGVAAEAAARGETRSSVAVERWADDMAGSICVIGNAPTALFRLLEMLDAGAAKPAIIIGFPVGFVGAAEAKTALENFGGEIDFITLAGRDGGSPLAAAVVNAIALGIDGAGQ